MGTKVGTTLLFDVELTNKLTNAIVYGDSMVFVIVFIDFVPAIFPSRNHPLKHLDCRFK